MSGRISNSRAAVSERIERLSFNRAHRKLLAMGGLGYLFDTMDSTMVAFVLPVLVPLWRLRPSQTGVLASSTYLGFLIGALIAGSLGDRIGRRPVMSWALVFYASFTLLSAFTVTWQEFLISRLFAGIGVGAESAIIAPFMAEFVATRFRGRFVGTMIGFCSFGAVSAACLGTLVVPIGIPGWRYAILMTVLPVGMLVMWRRSVPESPLWLSDRGRTDEANEVLASLERGQLSRPRLELTTLQVEPRDQERRKGFGAGVAQILTPPLLRGTLLLWGMWLSVTGTYYAFFTWIPTLLSEAGLTLRHGQSVALVVYLAQIPGYFGGAWLMDRLRRQHVAVLTSLIGVICCLVLASRPTLVVAAVAGVGLAFSTTASFSVLYTVTAETFPTSMRATGQGLASAVSRIAAVAAPAIAGLILPAGGVPALFIVLAGLMLVSGACGFGLRLQPPGTGKR